MNAPNGNKPRLGLSPIMQSLLAALPANRPLLESMPCPTPDAGQESQLRIEYKPGGVRIVFTQPTTWIAFDPDAAEQLAATLVEYARLARVVPEDEPRIILPGDTA